MLIPMFFIFLSYTILFKYNTDILLQEGLAEGGKNPGCPASEYCESRTGKAFECCTPEEQTQDYYGGLINALAVGACVSYLGVKYITRGHENS